MFGEYYCTSQNHSSQYLKKDQHYHRDYNKFYSEYTNKESGSYIKPGQNLFIADLLSRQNHKENKDTEISGMQLNIIAIQTNMNIPDCIAIHEIQQATTEDEHL